MPKKKLFMPIAFLLFALILLPLSYADNLSGSLDYLNDTGISDRILGGVNEEVSTVIIEKNASFDELANFVSGQISAARDDINKLKTELDAQADYINKLNADIVALDNKVGASLDGEALPKESPYFVFGVIGISAVIMIILIIFFFYRLIKNIEQKFRNGNSFSTDSRNIDQIRNFIAFSTKKGYSIPEMMRQLAKQGYSTKEINAAFGWK